MEVTNVTQYSVLNNLALHFDESNKKIKAVIEEKKHKKDLVVFLSVLNLVIIFFAYLKLEYYGNRVAQKVKTFH